MKTSQAENVNDSDSIKLLLKKKFISEASLYTKTQLSHHQKEKFMYIFIVSSSSFTECGPWFKC